MGILKQAIAEKTAIANGGNSIIKKAIVEKEIKKDETSKPALPHRSDIKETIAKNQPAPKVDSLSYLKPIEQTLKGNTIDLKLPTPKKTGYIIGGLTVGDGKGGGIQDKRPVTILSDDGKNVTVENQDGFKQIVPKQYLSTTPITTDKEKMLLRNAQEISKRQYEQSLADSYKGMNPIDAFGTKATDIGFRQIENTPSLGNPVADVSANIIGTLLSLATPTGGGNSLGGAMNAAGDIVEAGIQKNAGNVINKLPKVAQKLLPRATREVAEGLVYSASKAPEYTTKDWVENALQDATIGTALGSFVDGAKKLPEAIDNAKVNKQSKAIDKVYNQYKSNGLFPTNGVSTPNNILKPTNVTKNIKPTTISKTLTLKNKSEETAYKRLEEGIQKAQDYFQTNQLRTDEMERVKSELGIDLEKLADDYAIQSGKTKQQVFNEISNTSRFKRISGLGNESTYKTLETVAKQGEKRPTLKIDGQTYKVDKAINNSTSKPVIDNPVNDSIKKPISNSSDAEKLYAIDPRLRPKFKSPVNENVKITDNVNIVNSKDIKPKSNMSRLEKAYTKLVDNQYAINKFSKDAGDDTTKVLASNSRNAQGTVSYILKDNLVNKEGKNIGDSYKSIIDRVPKSQEGDFNKYMLHRHNIARMAVEKPVFGKNVTADDSVKKTAEYEARYPEFKKTAELYDKFMNDFMEEWGVKSGLIKEDVWKALKEKYPNYVPTYRVISETMGPKTLGTKQKYVDIPNPLKKATGSDKPVINPLEKSMELVDKTVKAAKYNEVGQSIVKELRGNPDSLGKWAEIIEDPGDDILKSMDDTDIEGTIDLFNEQFDVTVKKPKLNSPDIVRVMEDGKPVYIKINDRDFFDAVTGLLVPNLGKAESFGRLLTNPFKSMITTKNPVFAIRNIFRDIPTAFINGSEHNPVKFVLNYIDASKDMANNSEMFQIYKALGGGESNYVKNDLEKLYDKNIPVLTAVEKFNNFIESIPRYAEYKQTVLKGGNTFEAKMKGLYNANEITTNFARKGNVTKAFDAWIPYLNASFQGLDKLVRQVKENPGLTVGKGVIAVTIPAVAVGVMNKDNKYYDELSNRTKDNYYCIPNYGDKDSNGVPKTFIKIPKSREYSVMLATLFERSYRAIKGEKGAFKGFGNTIATNFVPPTDTILQPIFNLKSNKDFADRDIVPRALEGRSPRYQYDDQTTEIAKFLGDKLNISPKQIDYIVKSYTGIIGQLGTPIATKSTYTGDVKNNILSPITTQFKADPLFSNEAVSQFYNNKDKLDTAAKDYKFIGKPGKYYDESLRSQFNEYSDTMSDLYKELKTTKDKKQIESIRRSILDTAKRANSLFESSTK